MLQVGLKSKVKNVAGLSLVALIFSCRALAAPYSYPAIRYVSTYSESMGGVTLPVSDEVGNALFNNPGALSKNTKFKAEFLNLNLNANSGTLNTLGLSTLSATTLSGLRPTLNKNLNKTFSEGAGNLSTLSWGGLAVGLLYQQRVRAYSDGTNIHYQAIDQFIPTVGYGISLARGVVRLGGSFQFVNQSAGTGTTLATNTSAAFLSNIPSGHAYGINMGGTIVFPYTYLPTISLLVRNAPQAAYAGKALIASPNPSSGALGTEALSVDASLSFTVRVSGNLKTIWNFEFDDGMSSVKMPFLEKIRAGLDLQMSQSFGIRGGYTGNQFSYGLGYRGTGTEINLACYHEQSPFTSIDYWDTKYALQYKVYFQAENKRDREAENKRR